MKPEKAKTVCSLATPEDLAAVLEGKPLPPATGSVTRQSVEYWLQEERPNGWLDYARKDSIKIAFDRISQLKEEKPGRVFRCIARIIKDRVLSSNDDFRRGEPEGDNNTQSDPPSPARNG